MKLNLDKIFMILKTLLYPVFMMAFASVHASDFENLCLSDSNTAEKQLSVSTKVSQSAATDVEISSSSVRAYIDLENYILQGNLNNEFCLEQLSLRLTESILFDPKGYKIWFEFISAEFFTQHSLSYEQKTAAVKFFSFAEIHRTITYLNILEGIDNEQFWYDIKGNARGNAIYAPGLAVILKFKRARTFAKKVLTSKRMRIVFLSRGVPKGGFLAINKYGQNDLTLETQGLTDAEIDELVLSPIDILQQTVSIEDLPSGLIKSKNLGLTLQETINEEISTWGGLAFGLSLGFMADVTITKMGLIGFLKNNNNFFDKILEEPTQTEKKPDKEKTKKKFSPKDIVKIPAKIKAKWVKVFPDGVFNKAGSVAKENLKRSKLTHLTKRIWLPLLANYSVTVAATYGAQSLISDFLFNYEQESLLQDLQAKKTAISNNLNSPSLPLFDLYNFVVQAGNHASLPLASDRLKIAAEVIDQSGPLILCAKLKGEPLTTTDDNITFHLTYEGSTLLSRILSNNRSYIDESLAELIELNHERLNHYITTTDQEVMAFISDLDVNFHEYQIVKFKTYLKDIQSLTEIDTNKFYLNKVLEGMIAFEIDNNYNLADPTPHLEDFKERKLTDSLDINKVCNK